MRRHRSGGGVAIANSRVQDASSLAKAFDPSRPARPSPLAASTIRGIPLDLVERLRSFSVFSEAPEDFLVAVGSHLRMQVFNSQENIINEGEEAKAMYWLIRGSVVVTSRDRESVYAELPPGALFGEIGILMNVPRTANVIARTRSIAARLNKEDLNRVLPLYPDIEQSLREEAEERLTILRRKKQAFANEDATSGRKASKRNFDSIEGVDNDSVDDEDRQRRGSNKKIKPPSPPTLYRAMPVSALASGNVSVRQTLRKLPLFARLPDEFLHLLGLNAEPTNFPPFTTILEENAKGKDVFFITEGTVEVFKEAGHSGPSAQIANERQRNVRARLGIGHFFGEVTSLSLAPERTASVRSVDAVECLKISGDVIDELWRRCPEDLRSQVEDTARQRLEENTKLQVRFKQTMTVSQDHPEEEPLVRVDTPQEQAVAGTKSSVSFRDVSYEQMRSPTSPEPFDPDPFSEVEPPRRQGALSRRGSLANVPAEPSPLSRGAGDSGRRGSRMEGVEPTGLPHASPLQRPRLPSGSASDSARIGRLPKALLEFVFRHVSLHNLMRLRLVCTDWQRLITRSDKILRHLDLSMYNRDITDEKVMQVIAPFVGARPHSIDISNCFHLTDEGFTALVMSCGVNVTHWRLKSVWEISPASIIHMTHKSPNLISLDFSNCRKVSDSLLTRVVGWAAAPPSPPTTGPQSHPLLAKQHTQHLQLATNTPPQTPQAIIGCPKLRRLCLSYCKHVTDRFMHHLAYHASSRLEEMDLTRCTTISDNGFRAWAERPFPRLKKLVLADCTYLSDTAICCLTQSARHLEELDLSFCCALSDGAVERVAAMLPRMKRLDLAFCGSAVSDASMASIGRGLKQLRVLSVRGCVRVTAVGVEAVLAGCKDLKVFDVSQCKNLDMVESWRESNVKFNVVADGKWRVGK